ncbi:SPOR domain-containing protein [Roseateles asaccharophilus]|uniref:Cell division protein FtsN n=1 Tax=Roseateles asaccharophilus TaxID=582607 RepID=A0ABU2ADG7_9BURK|nr:SPOR domain-containing protein [Roseateles asaccharophilus]MDR7335155.1 cell division protein FtsN [Roseateles asaccharophilus]
MSSASKPAGQKNQKGGFVLGMIVGLLLGLAIALAVALYITKVPIPFVNKVPQRTAEQDAAEAERNRNWDPNAPLAGKAGRSASGVVAAPALTTLPPATSASAAVAAASAAATGALPAAAKPAAKASAPASAPVAAGADAYVYFVQAGAYTRPEDAEAQKAKLAIQGFTGKVMEREQAGRTVYRVRLGPVDTRDEAEGLQRKVEGAGFEANLVRVQR